MTEVSGISEGGDQCVQHFISAVQERQLGAARRALHVGTGKGGLSNWEHWPKPGWKPHAHPVNTATFLRIWMLVTGK